MKKILFLCTMLLALSFPAQATHPGKHILVTINGLVCDFCAQSMKKVFGKKTAVEEVDVDLTAKVVRINLKKDLDIADAEIRQGVMDAGYEVVSIKRD